METVHIAAYSHLLDTIGMPESEYSAFMKYKELKDKSVQIKDLKNSQQESIPINSIISYIKSLN